MNFEQIMLDLHAVLDRCRSLTKQLEQKLREANESVESNKKIKADLDAQVEGMQAREAACQKVENVQALHKDATVRHDAANTLVNAAAQAEKDLKAHVLEENSKLDEKRKLCARESEALVKRKKQLDDEVTARVDAFLIANGFKKG